jgi:hypothetical protein
VIAGLPWTAWLLLLLAVLPGVTLALLFLRAHSGRESAESSTDPRP